MPFDAFMPLKILPTRLGQVSTRTSPITACSAASGASAVSIRAALAPSSCVGFGRCTLPSARGVVTLDEAKSEFEASWKKWKAWAGLETIN